MVIRMTRDILSEEMVFKCNENISSPATPVLHYLSVTFENILYIPFWHFIDSYIIICVRNPAN